MISGFTVRFITVYVLTALVSERLINYERGRIGIIDGLAIRTGFVLHCRPTTAIITNTVVRGRIDEQTKDEAAVVLAAIGPTVFDAFRLMMVRIARDKALPFEPLIPNETTIEAMKEARAGKLKRYSTTKASLKSLDAGD